jgi:hypothetical protein
MAVSFDSLHKLSFIFVFSSRCETVVVAPQVNRVRGRCPNASDAWSRPRGVPLVTLRVREWIITQKRVTNIQVTTRAYIRLQLVYLERTRTSSILQRRMALDEEITKVSDSKGGVARF